MNQGGWFLLLAYVGTNEPKGGGRGTWDISRFGEARARIVEVVEGALRAREPQAVRGGAEPLGRTGQNARWTAVAGPDRMFRAGFTRRVGRGSYMTPTAHAPQGRSASAGKGTRGLTCHS